jgi:putative membrane protein (TIGR04086 family)
MRRNRNKIRKMKYYNIVFSIVCGVFLIMGLVVLFSVAGIKNGFPTILVSVLLSFSVSGGGFLSGYLYGKQKRHNGIVNGAMCGGIIYVIIFIFGIFYLGSFPPLRLLRFLPVLCIFGALGGVFGVNSKIKKPPI